MDSSAATFTLRAIGTVHSPYTSTREIPKGLGVEHREDGTIEIFPQYETGLQDIEGFSHLYVLWVFDRAGELPQTWVGTPVVDLKPYLSSIPEEKLRRGWLAEAEARGKPRA